MAALHLDLNLLWVLMYCSLVSGYFHDFIEEQTMMLKVFLDDDLGSTAHDRRKAPHDPHSHDAIYIDASIT
ncbi:hypothetical protein BHE74_00016692 [Ensete ventricosum]|nr:hypothetical protein BHE74_00016692 [Ensete ventricosum]